MPIDAKAKDIAWQLVHQDPGNKINIMLGKYMLKQWEQSLFEVGL